MMCGRLPYRGAHRAERDFIPEGTAYIKRKPAAADLYNSPSLAKENSLPRPTMM